MCGIFSYIGNKYSKEDLLDNFNKIKARGPDSSRLIHINNIILGFHRLAINDLSDYGMQPFKLGSMYLICNGEIYNHKKLREEHVFVTNSSSDCEVILHLYLLYGIEKTCQLLDGVFSFVLYDDTRKTVYVARDPYGVRPLFIGQTLEGDYFFSSEIKAIHDKCFHVKQFDVGSYL